MADEKISDMAAATIGVKTDQLEVLRAADNVRMTLEEFMKVINDLTQLASGIDFAADKVALYDADASAIKYVLANLLQSEFHVYCISRRSTNLTIATGWTQIGFNVDDYDPEGMHDPVTNNHLFTFTENGFYLVTFFGHTTNEPWTVRLDSSRHGDYYKQDTELATGVASPCDIVALLYAETNDTIDYHGAGITSNRTLIGGGANAPRVEIIKVGLQ